jgi:hypothetical protein
METAIFQQMPEQFPLIKNELDFAPKDAPGDKLQIGSPTRLRCRQNSGVRQMAQDLIYCHANPRSAFRVLRSTHKSCATHWSHTASAEPLRFYRCRF